VHNRVTGFPRLTGLDFDDIRAEAGVPGPFPDDALAEAGEAARSPGRTDDDATDLALVTIDPPRSRDLDQSLGIDRRVVRRSVRFAWVP
jgi:exoribonuclease R